MAKYVRGLLVALVVMSMCLTAKTTVNAEEDVKAASGRTVPYYDYTKSGGVWK